MEIKAKKQCEEKKTTFTKEKFVLLGILAVHRAVDTVRRKLNCHVVMSCFCVVFLF